MEKKDSIFNQKKSWPKEPKKNSIFDQQKRSLEEIKISRCKDIFEKHEIAQSYGYYEDPRWEEVSMFRKMNEQTRANGIVMSIRLDWGIE